MVKVPNVPEPVPLHERRKWILSQRLYEHKLSITEGKALEHRPVKWKPLRGLQSLDPGKVALTRQGHLPLQRVVSQPVVPWEKWLVLSER